MKLVIVESPTKSKTLQKFLEADYNIQSSYGHIRDLPKSKLGIDTENNFQPQYTTPSKAKKVVKSLKKEKEKADKVILATDEDREGESIAYHLAQVLELKDYERIVFHEITKKAIQEAIKNPREIDKNLVDAGRARRVLDRLVGYLLSPFLWKKVARGLSAGRVQSVAVKFIVNREKEIEKHQPQEYWNISATLKKIKGNKDFSAYLKEIKGEKVSKMGIKTQKQAKQITADLEKEDYKAKNVQEKLIKKHPLPPFTTATLQREAWNRLKFSAKKTMSLAQNLYEKGHITYHRTDSLNLASSSQQAAQKVIKQDYSKECWEKPKNYQTKSKGAQEAHEAIRPTSPENRPKNITSLEKSASKLYDLIWKRFIASQMKEATFNSKNIDIKAGDYILRASGRTIKFSGFLSAYPIKFKEEELPEIKEGEELKLKKVNSEQKFTEPPARYSEASLIKLLEKEEIGRPSTYASIIDTIQRRNYVETNPKKQLQPTQIGTLINDILTAHFPKIVDTKFTANMEKKLDKIAKGQREWAEVIKEFYNPFQQNLEKKYKQVSKEDFTESTNKKCPKCGSPLVMKWSKYGKFYSCSNFPDCKYKAPLPRPKLNVKCPKCGKGEIVEKRSKKGKTFYACNRWPKCDKAFWDPPTGEKCPKCGSLLVQKGKKLKCSNKECGYEKNIEKKENQ